MAYTTSQGRAIGIVDLSQVVKAGALGAPFSTSNLPSTTMENQLGEIVSGWDTTANAATAGAGGYGEFIWLAVPTSTTIVANKLYYWTPSDYKVVIMPISLSSTVTSGTPVAVSINAVTSDASNVQYTWFQIGGRCTLLKDAVTVTPNVPIYVSKVSAGKIKVVASTLRALLGARTANATTVTSTTSTVAVYINRPMLTAGI